HAAGLVGRGPCRAVVRADRSGRRWLRCELVRAARPLRAGLQMYQTRRLAMAADTDGRSSTSSAAVAGHGGRHAVDDHDRERCGARAERGAARAARPASAAGAERCEASAAHAAVPPGLALAAGTIDPGAAAA